MRITWEVLTKEQLERVDREARRILESTGLEVFDGELRNVMEKAGARVDAERIRFPSEMIDEALQRVPGTFSLYEISGQECPVAPGESYFDMYSDGLYIGEPGAKQLRPSTKQDVADFAALGQSQSAVDVVPNTCHARDYEGLDQLLHTLEALLANTNKLMNFAPQNAQEARVFHEMTTIASEGRATRERPVWKGCVSTTSPLRLDGDSGEVLRFLSENGIPFITAPCPMCGGTSPFSLIGTLVVQNAENLAIIAMAQTVAEGIPLIMGGASGPMDMRTGNLAYGAPERSLLIGANNEIHRYYGLPTHSASIAVNSWSSDVQTGLERELIIFTRMMYRPNFWGGAGAMCSGKAVSLVQALIDCHAVEMTKRYLDGINTGDALWAVEAIERVGPGGNFMMDPTTIDLMRSGEMWYSELTNMEEDRGKPMVVRAREEVDRILSEFTSPVSDGVRKELRQHVEKG